MSDWSLEVLYCAADKGEYREQRRLNALEDMLRLVEGRSHGGACDSEGRKGAIMSFFVLFCAEMVVTSLGTPLLL
jgi:hypothetical protein